MGITLRQLEIMNFKFWRKQKKTDEELLSMCTIETKRVERNFVYVDCDWDSLSIEECSRVVKLVSDGAGRQTGYAP